MKKYVASGIVLMGLATAGVILFGDTPTQPINPPVENPVIQTEYADTPQALELKNQSTAPNAGEIKTTLSKTAPEVTFSKWNGEASFSVKYPDIQTSAQVSSDKVEWRDGTKEFQAFPVAKGENMEDGGFVTQLVLHAKPASPVIDFTLSGDEIFIWNYQAPMNERGITLWHNVPVTCTETECSDSQGNVMTYTSVDMAGGYTLMYSKQNHLIDKETGASLGTNYQTGIFGHYQRPQFVDGKGNVTWGTQKYTLHNMRVMIPESVYNNPQTDWSTFIIK